MYIVNTTVKVLFIAYLALFAASNPMKGTNNTNFNEKVLVLSSVASQNSKNPTVYEKKIVSTKQQNKEGKNNKKEENFEENYSEEYGGHDEKEFSRSYHRKNSKGYDRAEAFDKKDDHDFEEKNGDDIANTKYDKKEKNKESREKQKLHTNIIKDNSKKKNNLKTAATGKQSKYSPKKNTNKQNEGNKNNEEKKITASNMETQTSNLNHNYEVKTPNKESQNISSTKKPDIILEDNSNAETNKNIVTSNIPAKKLQADVSGGYESYIVHEQNNSSDVYNNDEEAHNNENNRNNHSSIIKFYPIALNKGKPYYIPRKRKKRIKYFSDESQDNNNHEKQRSKESIKDIGENMNNNAVGIIKKQKRKKKKYKVENEREVDNKNGLHDNESDLSETEDAPQREVNDEDYIPRNRKKIIKYFSDKSQNNNNNEKQQSEESIKDIGENMNSNAVGIIKKQKRKKKKYKIESEEEVDDKNGVHDNESDLSEDDTPQKEIKDEDYDENVKTVEVIEYINKDEETPRQQKQPKSNKKTEDFNEINNKKRIKKKKRIRRPLNPIITYPDDDAQKEEHQEEDEDEQETSDTENYPINFKKYKKSKSNIRPDKLFSNSKTRENTVYEKPKEYKLKKRKRKEKVIETTKDDEVEPIELNEKQNNSKKVPKRKNNKKHLKNYSCDLKEANLQQQVKKRPTKDSDQTESERSDYDDELEQAPRKANKINVQHKEEQIREKPVEGDLFVIYDDDEEEEDYDDKISKSNKNDSSNEELVDNSNNKPNLNDVEYEEVEEVEKKHKNAVPEQKLLKNPEIIYDDNCENCDYSEEESDLDDDYDDDYE